MADPLSRERWVDAALDALASRGVDAVRIEPLARVLAVTKGSFYWHFRDRGELLAAMLRRWEQVATQAIIDEVEAVPGGADAKLRALFSLALSSTRMDLETALRFWARRDARVRRAVARVDERRMSYLQRLFEEIGLGADDARARSFLAYSSLFGDHFISGPREPFAGPGLFERCTVLLLTGTGRQPPRPSTSDHGRSG